GDVVVVAVAAGHVDLAVFHEHGLAHAPQGVGGAAAGDARAHAVVGTRCAQRDAHVPDAVDTDGGEHGELAGAGVDVAALNAGDVAAGGPGSCVELVPADEIAAVDGGVVAPPEAAAAPDRVGAAAGGHAAAAEGGRVDRAVVTGDGDVGVDED